MAVRVLALVVSASVILAAAPSQMRRARPTASDAALIRAFESSDVAEIYVVRRDLRMQTSLRPFGVRQFGCRYVVQRWLPQWAELRVAMAQASVRIDGAPAHGEMRVGLIFGDRFGTAYEAYAGDLPMPDGRVRGYVQRRQVGLSGRFAEALRGFAETHPELARVDGILPAACVEQARP